MDDESLNNIESTGKEIKSEFLIRPDVLLDRLDSIDIRILKKFYMAGPKPHDLSPYVQINLTQELIKSGVSLSVKAVALRLGKLIDLGLVNESRTTPKIYVPKEDMKTFVRKLIATYSANLGFDLI
jgi:DNA-binding Lrp family transcriptional regulator